MDHALDDEQLVALFHAYSLDHDNKAVFRARLGHELRIMRCGDCGEVSAASLALDACVRVLRDTGLTATDVDGIVGSTPPATAVQSALGIPEITWFVNPQIPFVNQLVAAVGAVYRGQCEVVLGYQALFRGPMFSRSAARDPFRRSSGFGAGFVPPTTRDHRRRGRLHRMGVAVPPRVRTRSRGLRVCRRQRPVQRHVQPRRGDAGPAHLG